LNVFVDKAALESGAGLRSELQGDLDSAANLIVLANPDSANSRWVNEEIAHWLETKSVDSLRRVPTGGDIAWDEAAGDFDPARATEVPSRLRRAYAEEPLWLDLRWLDHRGGLVVRNDARFRDAVASLAAPMPGLSKEDFIGEDLDQYRRSRRFRRGATAGLASLTAASRALGRWCGSSARRLEVRPIGR
jgi:hypothetical protein